MSCFHSIALIWSLGGGQLSRRNMTNSEQTFRTLKGLRPHLTASGLCTVQLHCCFSISNSELDHHLTVWLRCRETDYNLNFHEKSLFLH